MSSDEGVAERILIIGPAWVGDMVMAQSLFITLKKNRPQADIDVLAPQWSLPLLERMPEVSEAIPLPIKHGQLKLRTRFNIGRQLRKKGYTQAIILPRSYKAALIPFFAKIPKRTGYRGETRYGVLNDIRPLDKTVLKQTVQRQVALGYSIDAKLPSPILFPKLKIDKHNRQRLVEALKLSLERPVIGLMPGAEYGPAKQWPIAYYTELVDKLVAKGYTVWVFGSEKDVDLGNQIVANSTAINLCGKTQLQDVIDLLSLTERVVTNDSGLMHIACATGCKVVAIYGSSDPDYTPPLSDNTEIIYKHLECSPCFARTCKYGHYNCLKEIRMNEVLDVAC